MKKKKVKTAAILTIYDADKMTEKGRKEIADWLRRQAKDLIKYGWQYTKEMRARYQYVENKKKIAMSSYS
jgi:hypothetical protein